MIKKIRLLLILISLNSIVLYSQKDTDSLLFKLNDLRGKSEKLESSGKYRQALQIYKQFASLKEALTDSIIAKQLRNLKEKHEKEGIIYELKLKQAENDKFESDKKRREWWIIFLIVAFPSVSIFLILFYRQLRINHKAKILIQQQNEQIGKHNEILEKHTKEISDHLTYASIIQSAILTIQNMFEENFTEHFIFFKPKHIVSGDFYWITKKGNKIFLAVADCTGHGVQGAFISFLGMTYLNEIVNKAQLEYTDEILSQLSDKLNQSLSGNDLTFEAKDGMDIALCIIDREKMELQFSGAFSPIFIISNNNLEVLRGDRIPIGFSMKNDVYFSRHHYKLIDGDIIYLLTDGYCDQLGGESRKKFMTKRFNHLLLDIYQSPLEKQKEWLNKTILDWMGDNDQVDDITVIGVKI
jgi:serine phosphatase RsbU (regulator of sigma subunit)